MSKGSYLSKITYNMKAYNMLSLEDAEKRKRKWNFCITVTCIRFIILASKYFEGYLTDCGTIISIIKKNDWGKKPSSL